MLLQVLLCIHFAHVGNHALLGRQLLLLHNRRVIATCQFRHLAYLPLRARLPLLKIPGDVEAF